MKVYCGRNLQGKWKASMEKEKMKGFQDVFESEVPKIKGDQLWIVRAYRGYEYDEVNNRLRPVEIYYQQLFDSASSAKKSDMWQRCLTAAKNNPRKYHVSDFCIASDDNGSPFNYGSTKEDKVNVRIIPVTMIIDKKDYMFRVGDTVKLFNKLQDNEHDIGVIKEIVSNINAKVLWRDNMGNEWIEDNHMCYLIK